MPEGAALETSFIAEIRLKQFGNPTHGEKALAASHRDEGRAVARHDHPLSLVASCTSHAGGALIEASLFG